MPRKGRSYKGIKGRQAESQIPQIRNRRAFSSSCPQSKEDSQKPCKAEEEKRNVQLQKEIKKLQNGIKKNERWKMDLHKRHFERMHSIEIIMKLTEVVDKPKVDLDKPQKIIEVQIIGKKAGLSLLNKDEVLRI